ncbi:hypothetical protein M3Y94_00997900 [Aphelenchoides besseyi]|nr:hypothetical protein M3Y94_00997900 [Aphelenchoides besseyi]KAI6221224.1 hypothetical protein M3Y95_01017800 [Aphelenchoides besseyi]
MGGQPSKLRRLCRKLALRQRHFQHTTDEEFCCDDDQTFLIPSMYEMENANQTSHLERVREIVQMKTDISNRIQELHLTLDDFEIQHNRELDECANRAEGSGICDLEESRLRNALLSDKLKSCQESLGRYADVFCKTNNEDEKDTFVRQLLIKTVRRHFKKSRLNEALETFYQLIVATNGQLTVDEAWLLFEICSQKVTSTYEFYHRINDSVNQLDPDSSKFIINDLFTSMVENLRDECSETFDLLMSIRVEQSTAEESGFVVEKLKYLTASRVCGLWLEITPLEHDEFDDVKDLFYDTLGKDMSNFADVLLHEHDHKKVSDVFRMVLEDLCLKYPIAASSKRVQKIASRVLGKPKKQIKLKLR